MLAVSGQPTSFGSIVQIIHPDVDWLASAEEGEALSRDRLRTLHTGGFVPLYPSSQELARMGLDSGGFRRLLGSVLREHADRIIDPLPVELQKAYNFLPLATAMRVAHFPVTAADIPEGLRRLKYEELFEFQVKLALRRQLQQQESRGIAFNVKSRLARQLVDALPFALTRAQTRVVKEILNDMTPGSR